MNSQDKICGNCIFFTNKKKLTKFTYGECENVLYDTVAMCADNIAVSEGFDVLVIVGEKYGCINFLLDGDK